MPNMHGSNRMTRIPRGGGMTNTHGEYYNALPRSRPPTRVEQMQSDLASAKESLAAGRKILRWLLNTYAFERSTVTKIRDVLPGRK